MEHTGYIAALFANIWLGVTAGGVLEYLQISNEGLRILSIALLLDFILGIAHQYTIDKRKITSAKARQWIFRKITRRTIPFIISLAFIGLGVDPSPIVNVMLWILIVTEFYSCLGHIAWINGKKDWPEADLFWLVLQECERILKEAIKIDSDKEKKEDKEDNKESK